MDAREILTTLKKLGKPQTAAIYKRYGTGDNVFGVLTSEIAKLQRKIKVDHSLAMELWKTKNAEARVLALQVADPEKLTRATADGLIKDGPIRFVGFYLSGLVARSPIADQTMHAWMSSPDEFHREMGYGILGVRLKDDPDSISDAEAEKALATMRTRNTPLAKLGAVRDERRTDLHRGLQAGASQEGDRSGQAHRQGRGRPRRDVLQDARGRGLHREGIEAEAPPVMP